MIYYFSYLDINRQTSTNDWKSIAEKNPNLKLSVDAIYSGLKINIANIPIAQIPDSILTFATKIGDKVSYLEINSNDRETKIYQLFASESGNPLYTPFIPAKYWKPSGISPSGETLYSGQFSLGKFTGSGKQISQYFENPIISIPATEVSDAIKKGIEKTSGTIKELFTNGLTLVKLYGIEIKIRFSIDSEK